MSAAPESTPAAPAPDAQGEKPAGGGMMGTLIPILGVVILAPVASWAVAQFVIIPQLKKELVTAAPTEEAGHGAPEAAAHAEPAKHEEKGGGHGGKKGEGGGAASNTYTFENVVVNLAGTMGTRYLKVTFLVTGSDASLRSQFESNKPKLVDVTIGVLSALTLADLEEAGAKNIIREKLIVAYNQAFGKRVAEQIYFSDFVVQ